MWKSFSRKLCPTRGDKLNDRRRLFGDAFLDVCQLLFCFFVAGIQHLQYGSACAFHVNDTGYNSNTHYMH